MNANDNHRPMSELGQFLFNMANGMNRVAYTPRMQDALDAVKYADETVLPIAFVRVSERSKL